MNSHPVYYDITDLHGLAGRLADTGFVPSEVFVLADAGIPDAVRHAFLGDLPGENVYTVLGGEAVKNIAAVEGIWNFLLSRRADRQALLVNLGGGAVCDAGGFAASTYKRGIGFVQVPSTLLSMVDASVGGKTGINTGGTKNTVGTFAMPSAVCIHVPLLEPLPERELLSGYAEMVKHGLVADAAHAEDVFPYLRDAGRPPVELIRRSVEIKAGIVARDPHETGERKLLNFGHTVGHALESYFADRPGHEILHGEAVAAGMLAELFLSMRLADFPVEALEVYTRALEPLTRRVTVTEEMLPALAEKMGNDKKNEQGRIGVTLVERPGVGRWGTLVPVEKAVAALKFLLPDP